MFHGVYNYLTQMLCFFMFCHCRKHRLSEDFCAHGNDNAPLDMEANGSKSRCMNAGRIISSWLALGPTGSNLSLEELASKNSFERKGVPPMTRREAEQLLQILKGWTLADGSIEKEFRFRSYLDGLDFAYL